MEVVAKPIWYPWFENKKGMIQDATFIHSNSGHAKVDKPQ
jgi:hypothetical protein